MNKQSKSFKDFIKQQKKKNLNKNQNLLPLDFVNKLYDNPNEFFSNFKNDIQNLLSQNNKLINNFQQSIFEIFLELYRKENNEILEINFDLFFTELKDKINILNQSQENFLIIYAKRKDKLFFIKIFIRLFNLGLLNEEIVSQKNINGETCYLLIINEVKSNYKKILLENYEQYKNFFVIFKNKFTSLYNELNYESKTIINKLLIKFNVDMEILSKLTSKEIIEKVENIFNIDFDLIHNVFYIENLSFNLLNYLINRNDYDCAKELLIKFKNLSNSENYLDCFINNLFFILKNEKNENKNDKFDDYIKYLYELIHISIEKDNENKIIQLFIDSKLKQNIYHFLFSNNKLSSKNKRDIYLNLNEILFKNNENIIKNFLSKKDKSGYYPVNLLLFNINFEDDNSEQLYNDIIINTKMEIETNIHKFQLIYHPTEYIFDFLNNKIKFQKLFDYLIKNNLFDLFLTTHRNSKLVLKIISQKKGITKEVLEILINYILNDISSFNTLTILSYYIDFITNNLDLINEELLIKIIDNIEKNKNIIESKQQKEEAEKNMEKIFIEKYITINNKYKNNINLFNYKYINELFTSFLKLSKLSDLENSFVKFLNDLFIIKKDLSEENLKRIYNKIFNLIYNSNTLIFIFSLLQKIKNKKAFKIIISDLEIIYKKLKLNDEFPFEENKLNILSVISQLNNYTFDSISNLEILEFYLSFIQGLNNSDFQRENFQIYIYLMIFSNITKFNLPKYILKDDIENLKEQKGISYEFPSKHPISEEIQILLLLSLVEYKDALKFYEEFFLKINSDIFSPYYNILKDINFIQTKHKFKCPFIDNHKEKILKILSKFFIPILFNYCCKYITKNTFHFKYFSHFLFQITSLITNTNKYEEVMKKEIFVFLKQKEILKNKEYSIEQEIGFIENFIINYKIIDNKKTIKDKNENLINYIINFIKMYYKKDDFFENFITNNQIIEFIINNYNKEKDEYLLYQFIKLNTELNQSTKQQIISFIPPIIANLVNPADLLFTEYTYFISFNPFTFLLYNINLNKKEILEGYKKMFNIILNDDRVIEINKNETTKYNQYNEDLQIELEKINSKNLNLLFKNVEIIQKEYNDFNDLLKRYSFLDAFCYIFYHCLKDKVKNKNVSQFIGLLIKFPLFENIQINHKFITTFLTLSSNNFDDVMKNYSKEYKDIFYNDNFINLISDNKINFETYKSILNQLIYPLIEYKDITLFDNFLNLLINNKNGESNFSVLLNSFQKNNFYLNLILTYSIFKDDLNLFKIILQKLNLKMNEEGKIFLLKKVSINTFYEFSFLKKRKNKFSIFIDNYNDTIYLYLCLIASAEKILKYIYENFISINQLKEIYKDIKNIKYNLKQSIFISKNINFISEYKVILEIDSFEQNDYYLISINYDESNNFDSYINLFSSIFSNFSIIKLFINSFEYSNESLAKFLFDKFTKEEKEKLLNEEINEQNIIQLIVNHNKFDYLKNLIPLILEKKETYNNLLSIFLDNNENIKNKVDKIKIKNFKIDKYIIKTSETPIYLSIKLKKYECFSLLLDLYPLEFIQYLFFYIKEFSPLFLKNYFEYFSNKENKLTIKNLNTFLFIISECLSLIMNLPDNQKIKYEVPYEKLFGIIYTNVDSFSNESKELTLILKIDNIKISFPILYLMINIFKIYPDISIFDLFINDYSKIKYSYNEDNILYILYLMNKENHKIINVEKYVENNYGDNFIPESIKKIKQLEEYKIVIQNKNKNYNDSEKVFLTIEKDPMKCLINCCCGYFRIGYIIFKEYNLLKHLKKLNNNGKMIASYTFQQFNFLFFYQIDNYQLLKNDNENSKINCYERMNKLLNYKNEKMEKEIKNNDDITYYYNDNYEEFNGKMEDENIFDRFLISIFYKIENGLNINYSIIILSYLFDLTDLIINGVNQEIKNEEQFQKYLSNLYSQLELVLQKCISIIDDTQISLFFNSNSYENVFNELENKLDLKKIIETLYLGIINVTSKKKIIPTYLKNYYDEIIQQSIKDKLEKISEIRIPYLKYISKLKLYIFYIISFIDCLNKNNLESMYENICSNLDIDYQDEFKEIFSYISEIKTNWFNMFNIQFINEKNENEANQILNKSYQNIYISMNKILNLEKDVKCDFIIPYFYDCNNMNIYETTSKIEIYTYINNQFNKIFTLFHLLLIEPYFSTFLIQFPNKYILNSNEKNENLKEIENKYNKYFEKINEKIKRLEIYELEFTIHNFIFTNILNKKFNLKELIFDKFNNYFIYYLGAKFTYYYEYIQIIQNNSFLFEEFNDFFQNENNYGFSSISDFINDKIKNYSNDLKMNFFLIFFPEIKKCYYFIGEIMYSQILFCYRLNKIFQDMLNITFDCYGIIKLVNEYIKQDLIYQTNPNFKNINGIKEKINSMFKNQLFYRIFNLDNNLITTIINLLDNLFYKIKKIKNTNNLITFIIKINDKFNKGNIVKYDYIDSLNDIFDFENIECHLKKYNKENKEYEEIEIELFINMKLLQITYNEEIFLNSFQMKQTKTIPLSKNYEIWFSEVMILKYYETIHQEELKFLDVSDKEEKK